MKKILMIVLALVILSTATMAETSAEEKVVMTDINITISETTEENITYYNLKLEGPQNIYELSKITPGDHQYTFYNIATLECVIDDITNLTKEMIEECNKKYDDECSDTDGITWKEKYEGIKLNFENSKKDKLKTEGDLENKTAEFDELETKERTTHDNLITCEASLDNVKTGKVDAEQYKNYTWLLLALLVGGGIWYYFKHIKEDHPPGPHQEFPRDEGQPGAKPPE